MTYYTAQHLQTASKLNVDHTDSKPHGYVHISTPHTLGDNSKYNDNIGICTSIIRHWSVRIYSSAIQMPTSISPSYKNIGRYAMTIEYTSTKHNVTIDDLVVDDDNKFAPFLCVAHNTIWTILLSVTSMGE